MRLAPVLGKVSSVLGFSPWDGIVMRGSAAHPAGQERSHRPTHVNPARLHLNGRADKVASENKTKTKLKKKKRKQRGLAGGRGEKGSAVFVLVPLLLSPVAQDRTGTTLPFPSPGSSQSSPSAPKLIIAAPPLAQGGSHAILTQTMSSFCIFLISLKNAAKPA